MTRLRGLVLGTALAAALGAACVVTDWWEGSESSISFGWTVNGASPATACSAAGASRVHMWISQYLPSCTLDNENCGLWQRSWEWNCTAGAGTTGMEFSAVDVYVGWALLDDAGTVLDSTPWLRVTLQPGDNNLGTQPFVTDAPVADAAVVSTWTINELAADAAACTAAGGTNVVLTYQEAGGTPSEVTLSCDGGTGTSGTVLFAGRAYELRWELRSAAGTVLSAAPDLTTWTSLTPVAGENLATVDFPVSYGRLDVALEWADKVSSPAWGDCAIPPNDVAVIGYLLESTTGTVMDEVDITTSPVSCTTALAWGGVAYGDYHLQVAGQAASPATATWGGDCPGLTVDELLANAFPCQVRMLTP
jgi:hypothetical protein